MWYLLSMDNRTIFFTVNKRFGLKIPEGYQLWKMTKEDRKVQEPEYSEYNNQDDTNWSTAIYNKKLIFYIFQGVFVLFIRIFFFHCYIFFSVFIYLFYFCCFFFFLVFHFLSVSNCFFLFSFNSMLLLFFFFLLLFFFSPMYFVQCLFFFSVCFLVFFKLFCQYI